MNLVRRQSGEAPSFRIWFAMVPPLSPFHFQTRSMNGQPAETDLLTVTTIAPSVMEAEAAAKAAFILGSRAGMWWIESRPELSALFILDNGQMLYSDRMGIFL